MPDPPMPQKNQGWAVRSSAMLVMAPAHYTIPVVSPVQQRATCAAARARYAVSMRIAICAPSTPFTREDAARVAALA
ncbi:hypothetical protein ABTL82_19935, partial [Acinetobacter baumannii]